MKCEHGNEITVLIESDGDYPEDGISVYTADGIYQPLNYDNEYLRTQGCPHCWTIKFKYC